MRLVPQIKPRAHQVARRQCDGRCGRLERARERRVGLWRHAAGAGRREATCGRRRRLVLQLWVRVAVRRVARLRGAPCATRGGACMGGSGEAGRRGSMLVIWTHLVATPGSGLCAAQAQRLEQRERCSGAAPGAEGA
eukprot:38451-Chlamydomonas_euryale.AAC.2